jgi:hypothetical protein
MTLVTKKPGSKEKKLDKAVDMTFPASDPVASGKATGTEPPRRPADRKPPVISKEEIERARRGSGHNENRRSGR